jgi:hypothetical protein
MSTNAWPIVVGERVVRADSPGVSWCIVSYNVHRKQVGLSGPGPCRGMQYVTVEKLMAEWQRVP